MHDLSRHEPPILFAQTGPLDGQRWVLEQTMTIGRDPTCEIIIPNRQVSRYHARFIIEDDGVYLEDLKSKNGTYHNGKQLSTERVMLQDGDIIQVALFQEFTFISSDSTMPLDLHAPELTPLLDVDVQLKKKLQIDQRARRIWVNGEEIIPPLSGQQYRLLATLIEHEGKVVSREDLIIETWGEQEALGVTEQALDALVRRLRERLAVLDPSHNYIVTVRGHGLRLDNPSIR